MRGVCRKPQNNNNKKKKKKETFILKREEIHFNVPLSKGEVKSINKENIIKE